MLFRSAAEHRRKVRALSIFRSDFPPMLGGKGPLKITIGDKSQDLPLAGVAEPLRKFSATCFGKS